MIPSTIASALRYSFYEKGTPQPAADRLLAEQADAADPGQFRTPVGRCLFLIRYFFTAAFGVKILVTSRTRLMVTGEYIFDVWGLAYPQSPVTAEKASGAIQRCQAV